MATQDPDPAGARDGLPEKCGAPGPRGLRCKRSTGHNGEHAAGGEGTDLRLETWDAAEAAYQRGFIDGCAAKAET